MTLIILQDALNFGRVALGHVERQFLAWSNSLDRESAVRLTFQVARAVLAQSCCGVWSCLSIEGRLRKFESVRDMIGVAVESESEVKGHDNTGITCCHVRQFFCVEAQTGFHLHG